jgi:flagellar basal body rod protein FlgC
VAKKLKDRLMETHPLFSGMNTSTSGMTAQRKRMNAIAENIANIETTRTEEGRTLPPQIHRAFGRTAI